MLFQNRINIHIHATQSICHCTNITINLTRQRIITLGTRHTPISFISLTNFLIILHNFFPSKSTTAKTIYHILNSQKSRRRKTSPLQTTNQVTNPLINRLPFFNRTFQVLKHLLRLLRR